MCNKLTPCHALHGLIHSDGLDIKVQTERAHCYFTLPPKPFELSKTVTVSILQMMKLGFIEIE